MTLPTYHGLVHPECCGQGAPGHVALTFDDGPDPASTPSVMRALDDLGVRATFFVLGRMLERNPDLGTALVDAGHEVAVHGWQHRPVPLRREGALREDLTGVRDLVVAVCGVAPRYYRPPYGVLTPAARRIAADLGMTTVLWTTWGRDWRARASSATVRRDVARRAAGGGTVLLHDSDCTSAAGSWRATVDALPGIVDDLRSADLEVGPLRDHGLS